MIRPQWADRDAAKDAITEAQDRQERVKRQGKEVGKVTSRLWVLGQRNHFSETINAIFGGR